MSSSKGDSKEEFFTPVGSNIILSEGSSFSQTLAFSVHEDPLRSSYNENSSSEDDLLAGNRYSYEYATLGKNHGNGNSDQYDDEDSSATTIDPVNADLSSSDYLIVKVTKPQRELDDNVASIVPGSNTYVSYLIVTHTNIPEFGGQEFKVRRRFRDIVAFADTLSYAFRGYFIPPRPDKSIVESQVMQKNEFVEQRRKALEKYFSRLAAHPVIRKSKELMLFLQVQESFSTNSSGDNSSSMLDGSSAQSNIFSIPQDIPQTKAGKGLMKMWKELKKYVSNDSVSAKVATIDEGNEFLTKKAKLLELENLLSQASEQAEAFAKSEQNLGEALGRVGLAFIRLSNLENQSVCSEAQKVHSADAKRFGTAALKASRVYRETNSESFKQLGQLNEYLHLMQGIHTAFSDRSSTLSSVQTLMSELSLMKENNNGSSSPSSGIFRDEGQIQKLAEPTDKLMMTEKNLNLAMKEYEHIKEMNRKEFRRFDLQRKNDFSNMIKRFAYSQEAHAEKIADIWKIAAEDLSGYANRSSMLPNFP